MTQCNDDKDGAMEIIDEVGGADGGHELFDLEAISSKSKNWKNRWWG